MATGHRSTVLPASDQAASQSAQASSSSGKRQLEDFAYAREPEPLDKRVRRHSQCHSYSKVTIGGNAKTHMGSYRSNIYVSGNYYGPSRPDVDGSEDIVTALIKWLQFPRQDARREEIAPAHQKTFEWIYRTDQDQKNAGYSFAQWLQGGDGLFWIKGKAGSGKSTLMKMLGDDPRTHELLATWSHGEPYLFSSFYFWYLGTDMQKSTLGLLRSLLCDILQMKPELADLAFPKWQPQFAALPPTVGQVKAAFDRIVKGLVDIKVCFLIDGLDEYEGDDIRKADLAELVTRFTGLPNIKAVVSSRPLQVFESVFASWPALAIHNLTQDDIRTYATGALTQNAHICRLRQDHGHVVDYMIWNLTDRSSGVFLWAVLATKTLLDGCRNEDNIKQLRARLDELPAELHQLFKLMLERVPSRDRWQTYRFLTIMKRWNSSIRELMFYEDLTSLTLAYATDIEDVTADFWKDRLPANHADDHFKRRFGARLNTACQGLLEVDNGYVDFMHKSVADFLRGEGDALFCRVLSKEHKNDFDPDVAIMMSLAIQLRQPAKFNRAWPPAGSMLRDFMALVKLVETSKEFAPAALFDKLCEHHPIGRGQSESAVIAAAIYFGCELFIEGIIQIKGAALLDIYPSALPEAVFALLSTKAYPHTPGSLTRIAAKLLRLGADPYQQHCFRRGSPYGYARIINGDDLRVWELALVVTTCYCFHLQQSDHSNDFTYDDCLEAMSILAMLLDYCTDVYGSSILTVRTMLDNRVKSVQYTVRDLLLGPLGKYCRDCLDKSIRERLKTGVYIGVESSEPMLCVAECPCVEAGEYRKRINSMLTMLEAREKKPEH